MAASLVLDTSSTMAPAGRDGKVPYWTAAGTAAMPASASRVAGVGAARMEARTAERGSEAPAPRLRPRTPRAATPSLPSAAAAWPEQPAARVGTWQHHPRRSRRARRGRPLTSGRRGFGATTPRRGRAAGVGLRPQAALCSAPMSIERAVENMILSAGLKPTDRLVVVGDDSIRLCAEELVRRAGPLAALTALRARTPVATKYRLPDADSVSCNSAADRLVAAPDGAGGAIVARCTGISGGSRLVGEDPRQWGDGHLGDRRIGDLRRAAAGGDVDGAHATRRLRPGHHVVARVVGEGSSKVKRPSLPSRNSRSTVVALRSQSVVPPRRIMPRRLAIAWRKALPDSGHPARP